MASLKADLNSELPQSCHYYRWTTVSLGTWSSNSGRVQAWHSRFYRSRVQSGLLGSFVGR
jgi:hypothetical protein